MSSRDMKPENRRGILPRNIFKPELRKGVAATFRLRGFKQFLMHLFCDLKRRLKPAATRVYNDHFAIWVKVNDLSGKMPDLFSYTYKKVWYCDNWCGGKCR
jgi:hypothetical protein